jgi:hypothetical protein
MKSPHLEERFLYRRAISDRSLASAARSLGFHPSVRHPWDPFGLVAVEGYTKWGRWQQKLHKILQPLPKYGAGVARRPYHQLGGATWQ